MFMRKKREGFTLVELLIVMAVIAALMGALVPVAISAINHANATRIAENLQSLVTQVQQYVYSNHATPTTNLSSLSGSVSGGNLGDYSFYGQWAKGTTNGGTQLQFAIVYNPTFSATDVYHVWSGATNTKTSAFTNWVGDSNIGGSVGATGVVVRYW